MWGHNDPTQKALWESKPKIRQRDDITSGWSKVAYDQRGVSSTPAKQMRYLLSLAQGRKCAILLEHASTCNEELY